jgi:hypothetical protein
MSVPDLIAHVRAQFSKIYLGGIPSLLTDEGAFLSFICALTAIEALGGFVRPAETNGPRFKGFIKEYFSDPNSGSCGTRRSMACLPGRTS